MEPSLFVELLCGQLICLRMKNGPASAKLQNPVPIPELHDDVPCAILLEFGLAWITINKKKQLRSYGEEIINVKLLQPLHGQGATDIAMDRTRNCP